MSRTIPSSWLSRLPAGFGAVVLCLSACVVVQAIATSDESGRMGREITEGLRIAELKEDNGSPEVLHFITADEQPAQQDDAARKKSLRDVLNERAQRERGKATRDRSDVSKADQLLESLLDDSGALIPEESSPIDTPLSWLAVELQRFCQADKLKLRGPESTIDIYGATDEIEAAILTATVRRFQSGHLDPEHMTITFWTPAPEAKLWEETAVHAYEFRKAMLNANPEAEASTITTQSSIWPWTTRPCPAVSVTINAAAMHRDQLAGFPKPR